MQAFQQLQEESAGSGQQHDTKPPHLGPCAPWAQPGRSSLHDHYLSGATQGYGQSYSS
jgi:hypothetical protein